MSSSIDTILENLEAKIDEETSNLAELKKSARKMTERLKKEKDYNDKILDIFKKYQPVDSEIIKLNVGGSQFSTLKSTLTKKIKNEKTCEFYKASIFEELLSGDLEAKYDENKAIFIDRNPQYFGLILDYLRMANTEDNFELPTSINKNELKKEAKYYNLQEAATSACLCIYVSNGVHVWSRRLDDSEFMSQLRQQLGGDHLAAAVSHTEFLGSLATSVRTESFDLNSIVDVVNNESHSGGRDLIEFKSTCKGRDYRFTLNAVAVSANADEIKWLVFALYDKCARFEIELGKLQSRLVIDDIPAAAAATSASPSKKEFSSASSGFRKFGNSHMVVRKAGMSLINPMTKRKKAPKGVKFDDDEDNEDVDVNVEENSSESNDGSTTTATKFVRTSSNVSSQNGDSS